MSSSADTPTLPPDDFPSEPSDPSIDPLLTVDPLESYDPEFPQRLMTAGDAGTVDSESPDSESPDSETANSETPASEASGVDPPSSSASPSGDPSCETLAEEEASRLDEIRREFQSAWEHGTGEPNIGEFIPRDISESLRPTLVRELVLLDIQFREKHDKSVPPSHYLSALPECREYVQSAISQWQSSGSRGSKTPTSENRRRSSVPRGYGSLTVPFRGRRADKAEIPHADDPTTRYRPTRFHAKGGLGAVYRAKDSELKRTVALKEILTEHRDNQRVRDKFVFEAEVTGSLEHPGIVPVYGLGHYQDEMPYYAMRFIRGKSLRKEIRSFHDDNPDPSASIYLGRRFRALLRRLIETCNALHYAHEHGVLHRDIKPDNIMIGRYGETLVVDWGLAKLIDAKPREPSSLDSTYVAVSGSGTRTSLGSAVGTPMFMSPEQAHGRHDQLDGRTDVYSLGAVLFNMICGDYPFKGQSARDVVECVRQGRMRPLRSLAPHAPRALDSICRKAMAREPEERYATAVELAEDIERWLNDDRVIAHAQHERAWERAGRWIRRHRSWTISGAIALLLITVISIASAIVIQQAKSREQVAKERARESASEARAYYRQSRDAIDKWLVQSSDTLTYLPGAQPIRMRLLELASEDYSALANSNPTDPVLNLERGRAFTKLGDIRQRQRDFEGALSDYANAETVFTNVMEYEQLSDRAEVENAHLQTRRGLALAQLNRIPESRASFTKGIERLTDKASQDRIASGLLATAMVNLGQIQFDTGDHEDAIANLEDAIEIARKAETTSSPQNQLRIARANEILGRIHTKLGDHERAIVVLDAAAQTLVPLAEAEPDEPDYLDALASVRISQATNYRRMGQESALIQSLREAIGHYEALNKALPGIPVYSANHAMALADLGIALHDAGLNPDAQQNLQAAYQVWTDLTSQFPRDSEFNRSLATCEDALAMVIAHQQDELQVPMRLLRSSVKTFETLMKVSDDNVGDLHRLITSASHLAQLADRSDPGSADANFEQAIHFANTLIDSEGELPEYVNLLAHVHYRYGLALSQRQPDEAHSHFVKAAKLWSAIAQPAASDSNDFALLLATCPDQQLRDSQAILESAQRATSQAPKNLRYQVTLALANVLNGSPNEALEVLDRVKQQRGDHDDYGWFVTAMAQNREGQTEPSRQSLDAAVGWMQQHRPFHPEMQRLREQVEMELAKKVN